MLKGCETCRWPTERVISPSACPGWCAASETVVEVTGNCPNWIAAPKRWTITHAVAFAAFKGLPKSRPTIIKMCRELKVGRQLGGKGRRWDIDPEKFKRALEGRHED